MQGSHSIAAQWHERWRRLDNNALWTRSAALAYLPLVALAACLLGMVAIQLQWAASFLRWPLEVMYGEALIQDHAARLLRGEPLYQALGRPAYTVATYTPAFYALMALGQWIFGPNLIFGRIVSLLATAATAVLLGSMAGETRSAAPRALAALLFLGLGFTNPFPWLAIGKEDLLGVAFSVAAIAMLAAGHLRRKVVLAGGLAALAFLTKQTLIGPTLAGAIALALRDRRNLPWFLAASLVPPAAVATALELTTHAFVLNTVLANAQPVRVDILLTNLATLKAYQAGPMFVAGIAVVRRLRTRRTFADTLLPLYGIATMLPLVGLATVGSAQNYWIELAAASSLLAATEIWHWMSFVDMRRRLIGAGLALAPLMNVLVAGHLALVWLPALGQYTEPEATRRDFMGVVDMVRGTHGPVVAEPLDTLALASKPALVEPWAVTALYESGTWDIQPLVERVCAGDFQLAVLAHPLDQEVVAYHNYAIWPRPLLNALRRTMVLDDVRAGRYIYVRRATASCELTQP